MIDFNNYGLERFIQNNFDTNSWAQERCYFIAFNDVIFKLLF